MEVLSYAELLEKKLIDRFLKEFKFKLGYEPIVQTKQKSAVLNSLNLTMDDVRNLIQDLIDEQEYSPRNKNKSYTLEADHRDIRLVFYRKIYCYITHKLMRYSSKEVGQSINRDHSTVLHSCKSVEDMIDTQDEAFTRVVLKLNKKTKELYGFTLFQSYEEIQDIS
jgi:chromosomal replication initiation ATPase DnaA